MIADDKFTVFPAAKDFYKPDTINTRNNIIAGPNTDPSNPGMMYWNHSPGLKIPMEREEQPFPIQGNIGMLIKNEAINQYSDCYSSITNENDISGSPNCTPAFYPDTITLEDTCGTNCIMTSPESFGDKNFGFTGDDKYTNAHGIHAYKNVRAGAEGQSSQSGCYSFVPGSSKTQYGTCMMDQNPNYTQVGDWMKLPGMQYIVKDSWNRWGSEPSPTTEVPSSSTPITEVPSSSTPPGTSMPPSTSNAISSRLRRR